MFLTITSIIVAALFGVALTVAIRLSNINDTLRHKIKDTKFKNQELTEDKDILKSSLDKICSAMTHEDVTYYASPCTSGSRWVVLRRCFITGKEYHTFILRRSPLRCLNILSARTPTRATLCLTVRWVAAQRLWLA